MEFPEHWNDVPFFNLVSSNGLWLNASLEALSNQTSSHGLYETNMIRRVEEAWRTPLRKLTCEQIRLLVSQKIGLEWLSRPVLEFATEYPSAVITNYEGEMVALILHAAEEIHLAAPDQFKDWLAQDFDWVDLEFAWDRELLRSVRSLLDQARQRYG